jgi:hypothetical protein
MPLSDIRWNEFNGSWWRMLKQHVRFYSNDGDYKIVVMVFKRDYAKQCDAELAGPDQSAWNDEIIMRSLTPEAVAKASGTVQPVLK